MKSWLLTGGLILCLIGCSRIPFKETEKIPLGQEIDPGLILFNFREKLPDRFELLSNIVFDWHKNLSAVGYIAVNRQAETFNLACINPMGVKLFEISGNKGQIVSSFALEQFTKNGGDFAQTVGEDIRRIYFDLLPPPDAQATKGKYEIVFRQGELEYVFAGADNYLIQKNYYKDASLLWRVSYYEYQERNGKIYPKGIVLDNYKYGYRLIADLKEIQNDESP